MLPSKSNPVIHRHTRGIWQWRTAEWDDKESLCDVSIELAEDLGWKPGQLSLIVGPYRFIILGRYGNAFECYRRSDPLEEHIRSKLWIIADLIQSFWNHQKRMFEK